MMKATKTAREAKLEIIERLARRGVFLHDVVEWDLHCDDDDHPGVVFVYFSWYGGSELASFDWPWDPATFDVAAYERFFSQSETADH